MKRTEYLLAISTGFLTAPEEKLKEFESYFGERIELREPKKPGAVSLGGRDSSGKKNNFIAWANQLQKERIQKITLGYLPQDVKGLAPHLSAAFAGTQELLLQIKTSNALRTYFLQTNFSPQNLITPKEFVEFIDAQKENLWDRVYELVKESNELNNREVPPAGKIREYVLGLTNETGDFDFHVSQLLPEIQVEAKIRNLEIVIPEYLQNQFQQSQFDFDDFDSDREHVYFYPVQDITASGLQELVKAQSFSREIWEGLEKEFQHYPYPEIPTIAAAQWPSAIETLDHGQLQTVVNTICRVICRICEEAQLKPVVPSHLKDFFGPDELENKRAQARSKLSKDQWLLVPNPDPWEFYFFEELTEIPELPSTDLLKEKKSLLKALENTAAFATHIQSPFAEAFLLGEYLLSEKIPTGKFDEDHLNLLLEDLKRNKFSEIALENFQQSFYYGSDFKKINWKDTKIFGMMAISISDVFGGMGSWNDQYMETEEDQKTYEKISSDLFQSLKNFSAAVLSS